MNLFRNIRDDGILDVPNAADREVLLPTLGFVVLQLDTMVLWGWNGSAWVILGGGGGGSISIGSPVSGGTPNEVLFIDASGNLADSSHLLFDSVAEQFSAILDSNTGVFTVGTLPSPVIGFPIGGAGVQAMDSANNLQGIFGLFDGTNVGLSSVFAAILLDNTSTNTQANVLVDTNNNIILQYNDNGSTFDTSLNLQDGGSSFTYQDAVGNNHSQVNVTTNAVKIKFQSGLTGNTGDFFVSNQSGSDAMGWNYNGYNFNLPLTDGLSGFVLTTDGSGNLSFAPGGVTPTVGPNQIVWGANPGGALTSSNNALFFDDNAGNIIFDVGDTQSASSQFFFLLTANNSQAGFHGYENPGFSGIVFTPGPGSSDQNDLFINEFSGFSTASYSVTIDSTAIYYFIKLDGVVGNLTATDILTNSGSGSTAMIHSAFTNPATPGEWILAIDNPSGAWPFPNVVTVTSGPNTGTTGNTGDTPVLTDTFSLTGSTSLGPITGYSLFPCAGTPFNFPFVIFQFSSQTGHTIDDNWAWSYTPSFGEILSIDGQNGTVLIGDINGILNDVTLTVDDPNGEIRAYIQEQFNIIDNNTGTAIFNAIGIHSGSSSVYIGDGTSGINGIYIKSDITNAINSLSGDTQILQATGLGASGNLAINDGKLFHLAGLTNDVWTITETVSPLFTLSHLTSNLIAVNLGSASGQGFAIGENGAHSVYEVEANAANHWFNANDFTITGITNSTSLNYNDLSNSFAVTLVNSSSGNILLTAPNGNVSIGDNLGASFNTFLSVNDGAQSILMQVDQVVEIRNSPGDHIFLAFTSPSAINIEFGDLDGAGSSTAFHLTDASGNITANVGVNFLVQDISGHNWLDIETASGIIILGAQTSGNPQLEFVNSSQSVTFTNINSLQVDDPSGNNWLNISPSLSQIILGGSTGTNPLMSMIGGTLDIIFSNVTHFRVPLVAYANNAAAISGGLSTGDFYYTNVAGDGVVKVVI